MPTVYDASSRNHDKRNRRAGLDKDRSGSSSLKEHPRLSVPESVKYEKPTKRSLSAYVVKPNHIRFETQDRQEKIVLLLRRHVITNLSWIFVSGFLSILPVFLLIFPDLHDFPMRYVTVFVVMWYLFVTAYVFEHFLSWYYNVYIITDERIVDVDFHSLLYKEVSQAKIDNIQDVTFVMGGVVRAMLNFGTVYIQTAGEKLEFDFEDVPHPDRIAKILNELMLEEEQEKLEGRVR